MASEKGEAVIKQVIEAIGEREAMGYELSKAKVTLEWQIPFDEDDAQDDDGDAPWGDYDAPFEMDNGWGDGGRSYTSTFVCCNRKGYWTCDYTPCDS
jgi:hypothetical protein